jgi:SET domain-containing protein
MAKEKGKVKRCVVTYDDKEPKVQFVGDWTRADLNVVQRLMIKGLGVHVMELRRQHEVLREQELQKTSPAIGE